MNKGTQITIGVGLIALGVAIGLAGGLATGAAIQPNIHPTYIVQSPSPVGNPNTPGLDKSGHDWTIARCDLWANNARPVLPPYTMDSECVYTAPDGSEQISYAPDVQLPTK